MKYLLDTCVLSELVRPSPDKHVLHWIKTADEQSLFISVLTFGEIAAGVAKLTKGARQETLEHWLEHDLSDRFRGRVLPVDLTVSKTWGKVRAETDRLGRRLPAIDGLIAATALAHDLTVVTRNLEDMKQSGVSLFSPWQEA